MAAIAPVAPVTPAPLLSASLPVNLGAVNEALENLCQVLFESFDKNRVWGADVSDAALDEYFGGLKLGAPLQTVLSAVKGLPGASTVLGGMKTALNQVKPGIDKLLSTAGGALDQADDFIKLGKAVTDLMEAVGGIDLKVVEEGLKLVEGAQAGMRLVKFAEHVIGQLVNSL